MPDFKKSSIWGVSFILLGLTLVFCWRLVSGKGVFFGLDMVDFYSLRSFIFNEIKSGIIPLWNPYVFCGTPTATDSCMWGAFYPLNIIFILLPLNIAFNTMVILHIFLAGISMYLFMRSIEIENLPSIVSAITFMFSGYIIAITSAGMIDLFNGVVWLPLVFMLFRRSLYTGSANYSIGTGVAFGLQMLGGHPQVTTYTFYALLSYLLFYNFSSRPVRNKFLNGSRQKICPGARLRKSIMALFLTFGIGFGIYAIQFMPVWEYFSRFSLRTTKTTFDFASSYSLHPKQLITYLLPNIFSNPINGHYWGAMNFDELGTYAGILPLFLAGYAVFTSRHKERSYFTVLGLVSLFLAFGKYGFIYKAGYEFLPGFSLFRCPARWLIFTTFSLSILAGLGLYELMIKKDINKRILRFVKVFGLCSIITAFFLSAKLFLGAGFLERVVVFFTISEWGREISLPVRVSALESSLLSFIFISGAIALMLFLVYLKNGKKSFLKLTIITIIFIDLWLSGSRFLFTVAPDTYLTSQMWDTVQGESGFYRVLPIPPVGHYGVSATKIFCFEGGSGDLKMRDYFNFMNKVPHSINLMGGKYILSASTLEKDGYKNLGKKMVSIIEPFRLDRVARYDLWVNIYENQNAFPRAFAIHKARIIKNHDEVLKELQKASFNPGDEIILEEEVTSDSERLEGGGTSPSDDTVIITNYTSNRFIVNADFKRSGFLVLGEVFYPGWKTYIDEKKAKIYRANYLMKAIYLEKGKHDVIFKYDPLSFKIGAGITLFTIGCIIGFYVNKYLGLNMRYRNQGI